MSCYAVFNFCVLVDAMKLLSKVILFALAISTCALLVVSADELQTICPVMGGDINKNIYADHSGKRVYFCCSICESQFKKSPEIFIKKLEHQGVIFEPVDK